MSGTDNLLMFSSADQLWKELDNTSLPSYLWLFKTFSGLLCTVLFILGKILCLLTVYVYQGKIVDLFICDDASLLMNGVLNLPPIRWTFKINFDPQKTLSVTMTVTGAVVVTIINISFLYPRSTIRSIHLTDLCDLNVLHWRQIKQISQGELYTIVRLTLTSVYT